MPFGSRAKGKVGEREVGRLLEKWWGQIEQGCRFVSTPLSGGFSTKEVRAGMKLSGDLCTTAIRFPFVVEVKRREKWNLQRLLNGKKSPVWGWWEQAKRAAAEQGGIALLIFRKNHEPWRYISGSRRGTCMRIEREETTEEVYIGMLDSLLTCDPEEFACVL